MNVLQETANFKDPKLPTVTRQGIHSLVFLIVVSSSDVFESPIFKFHFSAR